MNIICSPLRNSLSVAHISSLIFISNVGPPVAQFVPTAYVKSWLAKGRRAAESTQGMQRKAERSKQLLWSFLE